MSTISFTDKKSFDAFLQEHREKKYTMIGHGKAAEKGSDYYVVSLSKKVSLSERLITAISLFVNILFSLGRTLHSLDTKRDWEQVFRGKSIIQIQCQFPFYDESKKPIAVQADEEEATTKEPEADARLHESEKHTGEQANAREATKQEPEAASLVKLIEALPPLNKVITLLIKPLISQRSFQRPEFPKTMRQPDEKRIFNGQVYDKKCYLPIDDKNISFEESYIHSTTFDPSFIKEAALPITPLANPLSVEDADIKGNITVAQYGYVIGTDCSSPELDVLNKNFDRVDGINWRDFPGEILIEVTLDCSLDNYISLLPAQLFEEKKAGDTVFFWWKSSLVALTINSQFDLTTILRGAKSYAYQSAKGVPFNPNLISNSPLKHSFSYPSPQEVFSQLVPAPDRDKELYAQPTINGSLPLTLHQPHTPLFEAHEANDNSKRFFTLNLSGAEVQYLIYPEHIAIVGSKEKSRQAETGKTISQSPGFFDDLLFILDFRGTGKQCSLDMLKDLKAENGLLSFSIEKPIIEGKGRVDGKANISSPKS